MQFRKLAALAGSAIIGSLAAVAPALAVSNVSGIADMVSATNYPIFVVGATADASDIAGAIGLAASLAANSVEETNVVTTSAAAGADGTTFRMEIGNTTGLTKDFNAGADPFYIQAAAYSGRTASVLKSGSLTIGGTEYKYYEVIGLNGTNDTAATGFTLVAGDTTGGGTYENQFKDLGIVAPSNAGHKLLYQLRFETDVPYGALNLTGKTIKFLGKDYVVTQSSVAEIKLSATGASTVLAAGEEATVGDYTVKVVNVGTSNGVTSVQLSVNGVGLTAASGATEYVLVAGKSIPVYVKSAASTTDGGWAEVLVGVTTYDLKQNTALEAPNVDWMVRIGAGVAGTYRNITLEYVQSRSGFTGSTPVLTTGTMISAPDSFFDLKFAGLESASSYKLAMSPKSGDFNGNGVFAESGVQIKAMDSVTGVAAKVIDTGAGFADTVAWDQTNGAWVYLNSTSGWLASAQPTLALTDGQLTFDVTAVGAHVLVNVTEPVLTESGLRGTWDVEYNYTAGETGLFANITDDIGSPDVGSTTPTYLTYEVSTPVVTNLSVAYGGTNPKSRSGGFVSRYGVSLISSSASGIELKVPKSQLYGDLILGKETSAAAGGAVTTQTAVPVTADVAMLDSQVTDSVKAGSDLIVVGGPCVNTIAAALLNKTFPACGADSGLTANTALIKVFPNAFATGKTAVLIAGWEAADTDLAARVVQMDKLSANDVPAVTVSGTIASPTITAVA